MNVNVLFVIVTEDPSIQPCDDPEFSECCWRVPGCASTMLRTGQDVIYNPVVFRRNQKRSLEKLSQYDSPEVRVSIVCV